MLWSHSPRFEATFITKNDADDFRNLMCQASLYSEAYTLARDICYFAVILLASKSVNHASKAGTMDLSTAGLD